jgi:hypothetical protein
MTRPRKQTVDYFPHSCKHGKTMFIIEQNYGNDGYSFWFKLLELMGDSEGHYLDCKNRATWHYLLSIARVTDDVAQKLLDLLSDLEAIDPELWINHKVVWSDNFVKGLAAAYRNRGVPLPDKPCFYTKETGSSGITTHRKPQMKGDERKGDESKAIAPPAPGNGDARPQPPAFSCECFEISPEYLTELTTKFPLLPSAYLTQEFFPRMRDWCLDNRKNPKHLKKFDARGRLKSPRGCFSNWLKKEDPERATGYMTTAPPVYTPPDNSEEWTFDRNCPICRGHPGIMLAPPGSDHKYDPCTCLHPPDEVKNGSPQATTPAQ